MMRKNLLQQESKMLIEEFIATTNNAIEKGYIHGRASQVLQQFCNFLNQKFIANPEEKYIPIAALVARFLMVLSYALEMSARARDTEKLNFILDKIIEFQDYLTKLLQELQDINHAQSKLLEWSLEKCCEFLNISYKDFNSYIQERAKFLANNENDKYVKQIYILMTILENPKMRAKIIKGLFKDNQYTLLNYRHKKKFSISDILHITGTFFAKNADKPFLDALKSLGFTDEELAYVKTLIAKFDKEVSQEYAQQLVNLQNNSLNN